MDFEKNSKQNKITFSENRTYDQTIIFKLIFWFLKLIQLNMGSLL